MKFNIRLECPSCNWGHETKNSYINQGWLLLSCHHCKNTFWAKITINDFKVETSLEERKPCTTIKNEL